MNEIQIACKSGAWHDSVLYAVGVRRGARVVVPRGVVARDLPERWFAVWCGLVEVLRGVAPGEWAAVYIQAFLRTEVRGNEDEPEEVPVVQLTVRRRWDDGTTAEPVELTLADPAAVAFFNFLTTDQQ